MRDERHRVELARQPAIDQLRHTERPFTPPNDEPVTRRPVMRRRGTMSSVSPLPATHIVASPHASRRLDGLAHDVDVAVASNV